MWQLRVVTGEDRGLAFSIVPPCELHVGRDDPRVSLALTDPTVSHVHARLLAREEDILVTDLGSANGTYANGRHVGHRTTLRDGDRLIFGAVACRVERVDQIASDAVRLRAESRLLGARHVILSRALGGSLAEITLPVILRLLDVSKKSCGLSLVRGSTAGQAMLVFRTGKIVSVEIDRVRVRAKDEAKRAIGGLGAWDGAFDIGPPPSGEDEPVLLTVDEILGGRIVDTPGNAPNG